MLLSDLAGLPVLVNNTPRGVCLGVGISLKNFAVKYLLCSSDVSSSPYNANADFCVNLSSVLAFQEDGIDLLRLRPVFPKNCAKIFLHRPVYSYEGAYFGNVSDLEISGDTAIRLFTEHATYPLFSVAAFSDAVILRKEQPYPIGQRIPAPVVSTIFDKNTPIVTKPVLRAAIEKRALIKLTLSLPPFHFQAEDAQL